MNFFWWCVAIGVVVFMVCPRKPKKPDPGFERTLDLEDDLGISDPL